MEIKSDEYDILIMFVENEMKSYNGQINWYKKYDSQNKKHTNPREIYVKRLELLKKKLNNINQKPSEVKNV